jgi:hypothetical protein
VTRPFGRSSARSSPAFAKATAWLADQLSPRLRRCAEALRAKAEAPPARSQPVARAGGPVGVIALTAGLVCVPAALLAQQRGAPTVESLPSTAHTAGPRPTSEVPEEDVSARTSLDRTAMFVGDRVTYTIEVTCRRGHDVLADDLSRDKLKLEGLDVVGTDTARQADGDVTRYQFRYVLTTYHVGVPVLKIAPFTARYYVKRAGQRLDDAPPAGAVQVPGAVIAFRSLLPDDQPTYPARDSRPAVARASQFRVLQPVGLGLILLSIAPVALLALAGLRRAQQRRRTTTRRSLRQARQASRASFEVMRAADPASPDERREAFARLDTLVRQHLSDVCGVPAASLTPTEIAAALSTRPSGAPVELASSVLTTCELARYAPPALLPSASVWQDTLAHAEQVLAAR